MNNHIQLVLKSSTAEMSLNDHDSGIYIVPELEGLTGLPSIRTTSGVNSGYDGGWTSAQNFDARSITIRGVIANTDVATVERMRKKLIALLAQGKNEPLTLNLVTEAGNAYELEVRTIACEMAMQTVLQQQEFLIQLRADDPLIYDSSAGGESVLVQVQHAIGGFEINFELPLAISGGEGESIIENAGLEKVYPVISMYGALHNPTFVNATTNQQIQVNATLGFAEGEWNTPSDVYEGKAITIDDAPAEAPLSSFQLDGETSQNGTPTPNAPVAVNTTTGENVVKITGKNLFNKSTNYNNSTIDAANGNIGSNSNFLTIWAECQPNTTYTISKGAPTTRFVVADSKKIPQSGDHCNVLDGYNSQSTSKTITTSSSAKYLIAMVKSGQDTLSQQAILDFMQIELGSTATAYEPYQEQSYEVNLGKNLCSSAWENGAYDTETGDKKSESGYRTADYVAVEPNTTYIVSRDGSGVAMNVLEYNASKTFTYYKGNAVASGSSFTTKADTRYITMYRGASGGIEKMQLEKGGTITSYAAYFTPIELCKIGTYQDYIYKSAGKWYKHKAVGKYQLDGTESWGTATDGYILAANRQSPFYNILAIGTPSYESLCSHFYFQPNGTTWTGDGKCGFNSTGTLWLMYSAPADKNAFLAWLGQTKPSIYFPLAESAQTDTEITNQALIEQLEAVLGGHTYAGTNNIFTITPNEQGTIELTYMTEKSDDRRDVIVIDSRMRTITLNGTDAYHLLAEGSEFPLLAPGENKLLLRSDTPGDNGYAEVNYKQGYLSI